MSDIDRKVEKKRTIFKVNKIRLRQRFVIYLNNFFLVREK